MDRELNDTALFATKKCVAFAVKLTGQTLLYSVDPGARTI